MCQGVGVQPQAAQWTDLLCAALLNVLGPCTLLQPGRLASALKTCGFERMRSTICSSRSSCCPAAWGACRHRSDGRACLTAVWRPDRLLRQRRSIFPVPTSHSSCKACGASGRLSELPIS